MKFKFIVYAFVLFTSCERCNNSIHDQPTESDIQEIKRKKPDNPTQEQSVKAISQVITIEQLDSLIRQNTVSSKSDSNNLDHLNKIALGLQRKVTISKINVPMADILIDLDDRKNLRFLYSYQRVDIQGCFTLKCKNMTLEKALSQLFKQTTKLQWYIYNDPSDSSLIILVR